MKSYLTIPNALTFLRGLGAPLFAYVALSLEADGWAILILIFGGITDYLDGKLARAWGQTSRFGELADPFIDRIYIVVTLIVMYLRDAIPLWVILVLFIRDGVLALMTVALKARGHGPMQVTYLGKAATFNLLYAFPLLLLALRTDVWGDVAFIVGWAFAIWGVALYLFTGVTYFLTAVQTIRLPKSQHEK